MTTRIFVVPKQYERHISKILTIYNFDASLTIRVEGEEQGWGLAILKQLLKWRSQAVFFWVLKLHYLRMFRISEKKNYNYGYFVSN